MPETFALSKTDRLSDPAITAGSRAYVVGTQDGGFPDLGWHVVGEMGGVWAHPIKLADGFWLAVDGAWLPAAREFVSGPYWSAFHYDAPNGLSITRRQLVPDDRPALVISYEFRVPTPRYLRVRLCLRSDLRPVWLAELDGIRDGADRADFDSELGAWVCSDTRNPWHLIVGSPDTYPASRQVGVGVPEETRGTGVTVALDFDILADREATLRIVVAGGIGSSEDVRRTFRSIGTVEAEDQGKRARYEVMLGRSRLSVPDETIERAWDWLKCNNDWLVRDVPGVGRGIGAGAADYVWWFGCDSCYAVPSLLALGQGEIACDTLDLLRERSRIANGDSGRVLHECTTLGHVAHPGCTQETAHFVSAVHEIVLWTGDRAFLERNYEFCRQGLLGWVLGNAEPAAAQLPAGYGIVEIEGLDVRCVDVAVHTILALRALSDMAGKMGDVETFVRCRGLYDALSAKLDAAFWMEEEGLYGDLIASPAEIAPRLQSWLSQAIEHGQDATAASLRRLLELAELDPKQDTQRPWMLGSWTIVCPIEAGLAPPDRAERALRRLEGTEFTSQWGMSANGLFGSPVFSINTGALAAAEAVYGRLNQAVKYAGLVASTLAMHMPGAISEISPDGGCFVQAWSAYGLTRPIVSHLFGFRPDAINRRIEVAPQFPDTWTCARLGRIPVGSTFCDLEWDGGEIRVTVDDPGWEVVLQRGQTAVPAS